MATVNERSEWIGEFASLISQESGVSLRDATGMAPRFYTELRSFEPSEAAAIVVSTGLIRREDRGLRSSTPQREGPDRRGQARASS